VRPKASNEIKIGDLPSYPIDEIIANARHQAICFLRPDELGLPSLQCGSGTFVRYDQHFGIVTAAHVVRALEKQNHWFVMLPNGICKRFDHRFVEYFSTPPPDSANGPDIGFIRLSIHAADALGAMFSPVNLRYHRMAYAKKRLRRDYGVWVEVGFPLALGGRSVDAANRTITTGVFCLVAAGNVEAVRRRGVFDYYDGKVEYSGQRNVPRTFEGMSGGGLWQMRLAFKKSTQRYVILDRIFSGVVFYEIAKKGVVSKIRSHGRRSVYDYVIGEWILRKPTRNSAAPQRCI